MGHGRRCRRWARLAMAAAVALGAGCQERVVKVFVGDAGTFEDGGATGDGPSAGFDFGWGVDLSALPPPLPPGTGGDGPVFLPLVCDVVGGRYCGRIGDGCGGTLDC